MKRRAYGAECLLSEGGSGECSFHSSPTMVQRTSRSHPPARYPPKSAYEDWSAPEGDGKPPIRIACYGLWKRPSRWIP